MDERHESARPRPASRWDKRVVSGLILALLGVWISLNLTDIHLAGGTSKPGVFGKVCEITGGACGHVTLSSWANLPGGIPLAFAGLVYFIAITVWYLAVGRANRAGRRWYLAFLALQLVGVLASLFLLGVMFFQLRMVCWWCVLTHVINLILAWITWTLRPQDAGPREAGTEGEPAWPPARLGWTALLLVVAASAFLERWFVTDFWEKEARGFHEDVDLMRYSVLRGTPQEIPLRADDPGRGSATPSHTVVVFSDFQCPGCKNFSTYSKNEILSAPGTRVIYRHFPVDQDCNPHAPLTIHPQACEAAHAAEAARELGGEEAFWKMHDVLFDRQEDVKAGRWAELAASAGLDGAAVAERVARRAHLDRIRQDIEQGHALELDVTPAVFVDGHRMKDWGYTAVWKAILAAPAEPTAPAPPAPVAAAAPTPAAP